MRLTGRMGRAARALIGGLLFASVGLANNQEAASQNQMDLAQVCVKLADTSETFAQLRESGSSEISQLSLIRRAGGPLILRDISSWMIQEVYSTLRYVPPKEVPGRIQAMCTTKFSAGNGR